MSESPPLSAGVVIVARDELDVPLRRRIFAVASPEAGSKARQLARIWAGGPVDGTPNEVARVEVIEGGITSTIDVARCQGAGVRVLCAFCDPWGGTPCGQHAPELGAHEQRLRA